LCKTAYLRSRRADLVLLHLFGKNVFYRQVFGPPNTYFVFVFEFQIRKLLNFGVPYKRVILVAHILPHLHSTYLYSELPLQRRSRYAKRGILLMYLFLEKHWVGS
jgi:hypothetical protein